MPSNFGALRISGAPFGKDPLCMSKEALEGRSLQVLRRSADLPKAKETTQEARPFYFNENSLTLQAIAI